MITVYDKTNLHIYGLYFTQEDEDLYTFKYNKNTKQCKLSIQCELSKDSLNRDREKQTEHYLNCLDEIAYYLAHSGD
jgi:hypothetical protein